MKSWLSLIAILLLAACTRPVPLPQEAPVHDRGQCALCDAYAVAARQVVRLQTSTGSTGSGVLISAQCVVKSDADEDLALVRILDSDEVWPAAEFALEQPPLGTPVWTVGHPLDLGWSISRGILSGYSPAGQVGPVDYLQTDAAISPGNSGGPLMDADGHVIGIVTSKVMGGGAENLAFARPARAA